MKLTIATDAWEPQVNGVVRTLKMTTRELQRMGYTLQILSPQQFRRIPCPTYPEIALALTTRERVARLIDEFDPDCLHIATEGPLGWMARSIAIERDWPFTTAYHSRFPEYVHARFRLPTRWSYALLRKFHNAAHATLAPTPAIIDDLRERGFTRATLWTRGVNHELFRPDGSRVERGAAPVFLYVGRLAVEKQVHRFLELDLPGEKWVAGVGPAMAKLKARFPQARWFGLLDGDSLAAVYRSADVMVFPSVTDTFGLVMVESMACGTPVAAYPVPGPLDVVGRDSEGGALHEDLRLACLGALALPREGVLRHAQQFTWAVATQQFAQALKPWKRQAAVSSTTARASIPCP
ncbi:MAG TPA: glycosyltransferase family 1 protein [Ramlibacter sp.]|uniref:glycosyltransferase family 4 protein n=1 Tax=Ramlibacter sp. TaxID=1917967 RepID=UPI002B5FD131|nr:glycosyltransferase family 1 protein [Ramlibacter sp.]HVZ43151.1 glycosyltransferase family 1 protein [Ramlibacter sp.]